MSKLHMFGLCGAILVASLQPAFSEDKPKAINQLKKANEGAKARDHVFDGTRPPPNAVRANPAPKPNPVGRPIVSTRTTPGYKPAPPPMRTINVPSPTVTRSTTTVSTPSVSRSTTTASTPSVSRSTTTTTGSTPQKKN